MRIRKKSNKLIKKKSMRSVQPIKCDCGEMFDGDRSICCSVCKSHFCEDCMEDRECKHCKAIFVQEGDRMKGDKFTIEILAVCGKVVFPRIIHNGKYFGDVKVTTVKDLVEDGYKKITK